MFRSDSAPSAAATTRHVSHLLAIGGGRLHFVYDALHGYAVDGLTAAGVGKVRADPAVAYVEPDMIVRPDNAQYNPGVGLDRIDQQYLPLDSTFTFAGSFDGYGVNVYIIDSGVRPAVANMSFGGIPSAFAVRDAINNVTGAGIPFVKSAGNDSANAYLDRGNRANLELVVGATDPTNDTYASFSDSGSTINIWAPGVRVSVADQLNPGYGKQANGTSFSAPYVSGFIAALLSKYPTMSSSAVYSQTLNGSTQNVIIGLPSGNNNRLLYAVVP